MHDAQLHLGLGIGRVNRCGEAGQPIATTLRAVPGHAVLTWIESVVNANDLGFESQASDDFAKLGLPSLDQS